MIELNKTDENCSNVYLIDENTCYGDSLSVINTNFATLTSNLYALSAQTIKFNQLFTFLSKNSATIIKTIYNINTINEVHQSPYSTVKTLSANWFQPFSLYYPKIIEINSWYNGLNIDNTVDQTQLTSTQRTTLVNWLEINFPNKNFAKNQIVYVFVNIYENFKFYYEFNKTYFEDCRPNLGANISVSCGGCPDNRSPQGCNITGKGCTNAWNYCSSSNVTATATYGCLGYNGRTLQVYEYKEGFDRVLSRVKSYRFKNNSGWEFSTI